MREIFYRLEIGYAGCQDEGATVVPDDMTNDQIDNMVHEMALEHAQSWEGDERLIEDWNADETDYFYQNVEGTWEFIEND